MKDQITKALAILKQGGLLLYPTDTVWAIGCDAKKFAAVKKIFTLKKRTESKALICLVNSYSMLEKHVEHVPKLAYNIIETAIKPTTIIYDNPLGVAENLIAKDDSLAIRVTQNNFCKKLIEYLGAPLVSTSANISGKPTPKCYKEIDPMILKEVDYIVNLQKEKISTTPSSILKLSHDGQIKVIRQ